MDKTPVPTAPSQSTVPKEVPTVVDSGTPKLYPTSSINTLGIRIFECPVCESTFRNHGTADAHIRKEHTKMKYGPCTKCGFTSWNGDSFHAHSQEAQVKFFEFFCTIFCPFPFYNIFILWFPPGCGYPVPWYNYLDQKFVKKIVCVIILYVLKVQQIQVWGEYIWAFCTISSLPSMYYYM